MTQQFKCFSRNILIGFNDHNGIASAVVAVKLHRGDVDPISGEQRGHIGNAAGLVEVVDDQGWCIAGKIYTDTVEPINQNTAAAKRSRLYLQSPSVCRRNAQDGGIWMCVL